MKTGGALSPARLSFPGHAGSIAGASAARGTTAACSHRARKALRGLGAEGRELLRDIGALARRTAHGCPSAHHQLLKRGPTSLTDILKYRNGFPSSSLRLPRFVHSLAPNRPRGKPFVRRWMIFLARDARGGTSNWEREGKGRALSPTEGLSPDLPAV